ncbi:hypothetical protein D3C87_1428160 [compost metagenome]
MLSGIQAVYLAKMIRTLKISETLAIEQYNKWIESLFVHEANKLRELYRILTPENNFIQKTKRN